MTIRDKAMEATIAWGMALLLSAKQIREPAKGKSMRAQLADLSERAPESEIVKEMLGEKRVADVAAILSIEVRPHVLTSPPPPPPPPQHSNHPLN